MPSLAQFIVWIVMGLLGGSLAGLIMTRERKGFGLARNMGLGLAGAIVGGLLFRLPGLLPGLDQISISLRDVWPPSSGRSLSSRRFGSGSDSRNRSEPREHARAVQDRVEQYGAVPGALDSLPTRRWSERDSNSGSSVFGAAHTDFRTLSYAK